MISRLLALLLCMTALLPAYQVILPKDPSDTELTAVKELAKYLPLLSKEEPKIGIAERQTEHPAIHVGRSAEALEVFGLSDWNELQPDEVLYRVTDDGDLWIAGEGPRGTIYAVYEMLEREYGVRFLTADDEYIPQAEKFSLPAIRTFHRYASPFIVRTAAYDLVRKGGPAFICKTRTNSFMASYPEWGGQDGIIGFVHTFDQFLPGEKYFAAHPEWYAQHDGKREAGPYNQVCLTNKEMRQELVKIVRQQLRQNPTYHFISVSQNDNQRYCQCDECNAFVQAHGNQTDLLLDCVNEVADAIAEEFPSVYVDTLAYNYTRQPPKSISPRKNVAIRYCTIEAHSFFPLDSEQNQALFQEMNAWRTIANKMLIWNYLTDFSKYYLPHPNWHVIEQDTRFFRECRAINIFQQGSHNCSGRIADLADLRVYLTSRLLWNPDLNAKDLIQEFCDLHYGPAAPYVRLYLDTVTALVRKHPDALDTCYAINTASWISDEELADLWARLFQGVKALESDPVHGPRMAIAALPLTMALMERQELLLASPEKRLAPLQDVDPVALTKWCEETLALAENDGLSEGRDSAGYWLNKLYGLHAHRLVLPPVPCAGNTPAELDGQPCWAWNMEDLGRLSLNSPGTVTLADDANAVDGKAFRMPCTHHEWYVQARNLPRATFDVYLEIRCDIKAGCKAEGPVISFGNYPAGPYVDGKVTADQIAGPEYKLVKVGRSDFTKANYFYCAPVVNPNAEWIWIDRLIVTNPTDAEGRPLDPPEE